MERSFKLLAIILSIGFLYSACKQDSKIAKQKVGATNFMAARTAAYFDTIKYDDEVLYRRITSKYGGESLGVWFTPPRAVKQCSLVAVEYLFANFPSHVADSFQVKGFVNKVVLYKEGGPPLMTSGATIDTFLFWLKTFDGKKTIKLKKPIPTSNYSDFFIGWISRWLPSQELFPIGLADSSGCCRPYRSYRSSQNGGLYAFQYDLGIRAIFKSVHDTGNYTIELQWKQPKADLDLYLILPITHDTVCWRNRSFNNLIILDVDDDDGYGPEKIICPILAYPNRDSSAKIGVHYYGPSKGKHVQARVIIKKNDVAFDTLGWCNLRPKDWWNVATINLSRAAVRADTCNIIQKPALSRQHKH